MKKRVTGIGGIFIKSKGDQKSAKALQDWYGKHLNINPLPHSPWGDDDDAPLFEWRDKNDPERLAYSVFSVFDSDNAELNEGQHVMLNFRVEDLRGLLKTLQSEGVQVGEIREYPYGLFAYITDPEGNKIELWEPAEGF